jgi:hypothetical protein
MSMPHILRVRLGQVGGWADGWGKHHLGARHFVRRLRLNDTSACGTVVHSLPSDLYVRHRCSSRSGAIIQAFRNDRQNVKFDCTRGNLILIHIASTCRFPPLLCLTGFGGMCACMRLYIRAPSRASSNDQVFKDFAYISPAVLQNEIIATVHDKWKLCHDPASVPLPTTP